MKIYIEPIINLIEISFVKAILFIIGSILAAKIADFIITRILSRLVNQTSSTIDDKIISILHRPIYYSILFLGLGISVELFQMPTVITNTFIRIFKTITIIFWSTALFHSFMHVISWYSQSSKKDSMIQKHTLPVFDNTGKVVIFLLAVYFVLISWGVDVTGLLASATVLGVTLSFAAKDTVANLFSGFFIMADTPYKPGDYINLDGGERGYVKTIGLRSTRIMTRDDIEITLPNSLIANSKIINESGGPKENERIRININVSYGSDIEKVRKILMKIGQDSQNICTIPKPRVRFRNFEDSSLRFELLAWIEKPANRGRIIDELNSNIYNTFNDEKIEFPYPQRTIHIKNTNNNI